MNDFTVGSGNVFYDVGLENFNSAMCRSSCLILITRIIKEKKLNQTQIGEILEMDQPKVSRLLSTSGKGFSLEKLFHILEKLGCVVSVEVSKV